MESESKESKERKEVGTVNSEVGWEYTNGFMPKIEDSNPPIKQEPR